MRIKELTPLLEFFDPTAGMAGVLSDYLISLKASGVDSIRTDAAVDEIKKRYGQDLTLEDITAIHSEGKLPMVKDITRDEIFLDIRDSEIKNKKPVNNAEEKVKNMARSAAADASKEI